ncbi:hypothetical protein FLK61_37430 [Paenalkalicoccus suaedae]|uniref:Uncharacterized protein n=1 Tax=Paenalkalicoccus suaedae TaxID=2592382 RepID=A0A859FHL6_9BACI|nr:hypothetical protein [Paenalkalicoccus suaedae]QKS72318.1 hypothetical protein FLK61_37430 [Paenalkalicoccus suaedae]
MPIHFNWRITKYDPGYRSYNGNYLREEWTSISDICHVFEGSLTPITIHDYLQVENSYVDAVVRVMDCLKIETLEVRGLEKWEEALEISQFNEIYSQKMRELYSHTSEGISLNKVEISLLCRLILREHIWCRLHANDSMFVHFGHDYYMFIGSEKKCADTLQKIRESGLFVEDFHSPINVD